MRQILFLLLLLSWMAGSVFPQKNGGKKKKDYSFCWTPYLSTHFVSPDVYVTKNQPGVGFGCGHSFVWRLASPKEKSCWLGFDFNHHYFGSKKIGDNTVFYEHWQFGGIFRFPVFNNPRFYFFTDIDAGIRSMASFTSHERTYTQIIVTRMVEVAANNGDNNDWDDLYNIQADYERLDYFAGLSPGVILRNKEGRNNGLTIRLALNIGTKVRYVDRRLILTEGDTFNYPVNKGKGMFFNLQLGYSLN